MMVKPLEQKVGSPKEDLEGENGGNEQADRLVFVYGALARYVAAKVSVFKDHVQRGFPHGKLIELPVMVGQWVNETMTGSRYSGDEVAETLRNLGQQTCGSISSLGSTVNDLIKDNYGGDQDKPVPMRHLSPSRERKRQHAY
ncbi:MAG: hypothetical protein QGH47_05355 [Candidatus Woesearchaeota archaeon]|nr:hypothetical protein [Candidatus Woesearchaeota archaeon]